MMDRIIVNMQPNFWEMVPTKKPLRILRAPQVKNRYPVVVSSLVYSGTMMNVAENTVKWSNNTNTMEIQWQSNCFHRTEFVVRLPALINVDRSDGVTELMVNKFNNFSGWDLRLLEIEYFWTHYKSVSFSPFLDDKYCISVMSSSCTLNSLTFRLCHNLTLQEIHHLQQESGYLQHR